MTRDPTFLGTVQDVQGGTVRVLLDEKTVSGLTFVFGQSYRIGQVGSFVRIPLGYVNLFGVVSQVGAGAVPESMQVTQPYGNRWLQVQIVGEGRSDGEFQRGVSQYPTIDDPVHLVTEADLFRIYGRSSTPELVKVGCLASAESIPALIDINKLVTRHSAVLGSTGSGKSTTVAGLLSALASYPSARIVVMDIHGEYRKALKGKSSVFRINADLDGGEQELYVPYWALTFDELLPVTFGVSSSNEDSGRSAIQEKLAALKRGSLAKAARPGVNEDSVTVDTPVPFSIHRAWHELHSEMRSTHYEKAGTPQSRDTWALEKDIGGNELAGDPLKGIPPRFLGIRDEKNDPLKIRRSQSPLNVGRQVDQLGARIRDPRFNFLLQPGPWLPSLEGIPEKDLDVLVQSWLGSEQPITILDLSGIPTTILGDLVGAILRIMYDALFWARNLSAGGRERPLLLVMEEAHSYLSSALDTPAARTVKRIVKEGRKYGIGIMIVSQRPSEIDATILSQCGTLFAMRLANPSDRSHVTGAAADHLEGLFSMLPVLRTGEAIIIGEAVQLPVRTLIETPSKHLRPDSEDPKAIVKQYSDGTFESPYGWNQPRLDERYDEVMEVWRRQTHTKKSEKKVTATKPKSAAKDEK